MEDARLVSNAAKLEEALKVAVAEWLVTPAEGFNPLGHSSPLPILKKYISDQVRTIRQRSKNDERSMVAGDAPRRERGEVRRKGGGRTRRDVGRRQCKVAGDGDGAAAVGMDAVRRVQIQNASSCFVVVPGVRHRERVLV